MRAFRVNAGVIEREINSSATVTFTHLVDLTAIEAVRAKQDKISYTAFVVKALANAMQDHPYANRRAYRKWLGFGPLAVQQFLGSDIAVAVELPEAEFGKFSEGCAFTGILKNADKHSLTTLAAKLSWMRSCLVLSGWHRWENYSELIRSHFPWLASRILSFPRHFASLWTEYRGGAAIVSSPAKYGVDCIMASWPWPVGVSFGLVKDRPIVKHGSLQVAPTFTLSLNFDRRIMAGAPAARFFHSIVDYLEHPEKML